jgi:DNA-binding MarR family transcriptional regulator
MVVKSNDTAEVALEQLDLAYLGMFLGLRVNDLVIERGRKAGLVDMRESHGYVIQHLIESERSITDIARRMEVSQQAASKAVAELVQLGVVELRPSDDRRERLVRLTSRGWNAIRVTRSVRRQIDNKLRKIAGSGDYATAKRVLTACLEALGDVERIRQRRIRTPR